MVNGQGRGSMPKSVVFSYSKAFFRVDLKLINLRLTVRYFLFFSRVDGVVKRQPEPESVSARLLVVESERTDAEIDVHIFMHCTNTQEKVWAPRALVHIVKFWLTISLICNEQHTGVIYSTKAKADSVPAQDGLFVRLSSVRWCRIPKQTEGDRWIL